MDFLFFLNAFYLQVLSFKLFFFVSYCGQTYKSFFKINATNFTFTRLNDYVSKDVKIIFYTQNLWKNRLVAIVYAVTFFFTYCVYFLFSGIKREIKLTREH